jgi:Ca2+-binding RTX toxin-like protein
MGASYRWNGVTDHLLSVDETAARAIETAALTGTGIGAEMRFVVVNHTKYGGGGGYYATYAGGNGSARELALHEIGHSFAGLADEYQSGGAVAYTGPELPKPNVTTDAGGAKWAAWIGYDQPGIGVIGAYEGAYYHERGVYRPSLNSKMRSLEQPFDAIAREQFIRQFHQLVDPLDGYTENSTEKRNPTSLSVDVVDPDVVEVDWSVGGRTFAGLGETLTFDFDYLDFGTYTVRARAYDDTDWVRGDRTALEQTVTWTVVNDTRLYGGSLNDTLVGNGIANDIQGRNGGDALAGGAGNDAMSGDAGDDRVSGGTGNDHVFGGVGNDRLTGGRGRDIETGGSGRDRFIFDDRDTGASRKLADSILDFRGGLGDRLDLRLVDANAKARGDQKFAFIGEAEFTRAGQVRYEHTSRDTWVYLNTDADASAEATIRLNGVFDLHSKWFLL